MRRMYSLNQLQEIALKKIESTTSLKVFENIVDKDGHKRFIEGEITTYPYTDVSYSYAKWALSGSHLIIVVAMTFAPKEWTYAVIAEVNLPQWIKDKLIPFFSSASIDVKSVVFYDSSYATKNPIAFLVKDGNTIKIALNTITFTSTSNGRIEFDLLIDNE